MSSPTILTLPPCGLTIPKTCLITHLWIINGINLPHNTLQKHVWTLLLYAIHPQLLTWWIEMPHLIRCESMVNNIVSFYHFLTNFMTNISNCPAATDSNYQSGLLSLLGRTLNQEQAPQSSIKKWAQLNKAHKDMNVDDDKYVKEQEDEGKDHDGNHPDDLCYKFYDVLRGKTAPSLQFCMGVNADFTLSLYFGSRPAFKICLTTMVSCHCHLRIMYLIMTGQLEVCHLFKLWWNSINNLKAISHQLKIISFLDSMETRFIDRDIVWKS